MSRLDVKVLTLLLILASFAGSCASPVYGQAPHWVAIRAGRLFDSKSGNLRGNQVVLVQDDKIVAVGPAGHHLADGEFGLRRRRAGR